jgi:uncharacterized protein (DUF427 family)/glutaredoxin
VERSPAAQARIEVLWRPGCLFCSSLRRGLRRAGIRTVEHDIWADPDAAARVRAVTGGDETVPTVVVGTRALINPSVSQVVSAVRSEFGRDADDLIGQAPAAGPRPWRTGAGWTAVAALVWVLLAVWQPTTTWQLLPPLLAGALPWIVGQDLRAGDRSAAARLAGAGAVGFVIAALVTLGLARFDLLRGPTILGFGNPTIEALVLAGAAAVVLVLVGLPKAFTTPLTRSAWIGSERLASSTDVVIVEGNAYFPPSSVRRGGLTPSRTTSVCPWKGIARYYTVTADGVELTDAAWSYPHPLPFARRVKGRIAFGAGVDVGRE